MKLIETSLRECADLNIAQGLKPDPFYRRYRRD